MRTTWCCSEPLRHGIRNTSTLWTLTAGRQTDLLVECCGGSWYAVTEAHRLNYWLTWLNWHLLPQKGVESWLIATWITWWQPQQAGMQVWGKGLEAWTHLPPHQLRTRETLDQVWCQQSTEIKGKQLYIKAHSIIQRTSHLPVFFGVSDKPPLERNWGSPFVLEPGYVEF